MSSEERRKILQMVQEGKISAEQASSLMRALEAANESRLPSLKRSGRVRVVLP